jgi:CHAT domain-containing protein
LRYIPFAALHDGKQYLVQVFRQSLITPASIDRLREEPEAQCDGIGFGVPEGQSPLPSVPGELHGIFRETTDSKAPVPGVVLLNAAFTHQSFIDDLERKRNRVVHIATHFSSRAGVAANSELLLGDGPAVSVCGMGRFPVTLYYEQWIRLFNAADNIKALIEENKSKLKVKEEA